MGARPEVPSGAVFRSAADSSHSRRLEAGGAPGKVSQPAIVRPPDFGSTAVRPERPPVGGQSAAGNRTAGAPVGNVSPRPIPSDFPPVVYLPCAETVADPKDARIDMRETRDGRTALLAYSALDRLRQCCGDKQAWVLMPTANLSQLQAARPFQLLMLDVEIPVEHRRRRS